MPSIDSTGKSISFERWINGMSEDEYADMLDESNPNGFSDAQEEKALNIRQPPTIEEQEELELEQEFEDTTPVRTGERFTVDESVTTERDIEIEQPVSQQPTPVVTPPITQPRVAPPKPPKITQQIKQTVQSVGKFIRRFFRV